MLPPETYKSLYLEVFAYFGLFLMPAPTLGLVYPCPSWIEQDVMALTLCFMVDRASAATQESWLLLTPCAVRNCVTSNNPVYFNLCPLCKMKTWTSVRSHKPRCLLGPGPWPKGAKNRRSEPSSQAAAICSLQLRNHCSGEGRGPRSLYFSRGARNLDAHVLVFSVDK